jgi:RNA polymerase sigma-70 factor (ECF subfamily)
VSLPAPILTVIRRRSAVSCARGRTRLGTSTLPHDRGRFRAFLLGSLKHFLINDARDRRALKRGGGQVLLSIEGDQAEGRYLREPADERTPEALFERRWAFTVLERALQRLRPTWEQESRADKFDRRQACLTGDTPVDGYAGVARALGMTEGAVKVAVHRLKREFRDVLRQEVADTVDDERLVAQEVKDLLRIIS